VRGEEGNLLVYSEMANTIRKNTDASARDGVGVMVESGVWGEAGI